MSILQSACERTINSPESACYHYPCKMKHMQKFLALRMLSASSGVLQDWSLHWIHFQQLVQFVGRLGSRNRASSSNTLSWRANAGQRVAQLRPQPASAAPGKASWANTGQSQGKLIAHVERLLKTHVSRHLLNLFRLRTALLKLLKESQRTKATTCSSCQRCK